MGTTGSARQLALPSPKVGIENAENSQNAIDRPNPIIGPCRKEAAPGAAEKVVVSALPVAHVPADRIPFLQQSRLMMGLTSAECADFCSKAHPQEYERRKMVLQEGQPSRRVMLLTRGSMKLTQLCNSGDEVILGLAAAGDVIGGMATTCGGCYPHSANTLEKSAALCWESADFERALDRYPRARQNVIRMLAERLERLQTRFAELATERANVRLACTLVRLVRHVGRASEGAVSINLSQSELAQMTGMTLFTVSRLLSEWEALGVLDRRRERILVRAYAPLCELAGCEYSGRCATAENATAVAVRTRDILTY